MSAIRLEVETHIVTASATAVQNLTKCVTAAGVKIDELVAAGARLGRGGPVRDREGPRRRRGRHRRRHDRPRPLRRGLAVPHRGPAGRREQRHQRRRDRAQDQPPGRRGAEDPPRHRDLRGIDEDEVDQRLGPRRRGRPHREPPRGLPDHRGPDARDIRAAPDRDPERPAPAMLPAGIVLTGGASQLAGVAELGREILEMPVRVAAAEPMSAASSTTCSTPVYSTAIGPAPVGRGHVDRSGTLTTTSRRPPGGGFGRLRDALRSIFP